MPTYNINMGSNSPYEGWGKAASELGKALTPDYEGQANARLRNAQVGQANAGAAANNALARERALKGDAQLRLNNIWKEFDGFMGQDLDFNEKLQLFPEYLMRLGEVDGSSLGDFALSSAGIMNATGATGATAPGNDPAYPSVFNQPQAGGPAPMFDNTALQNLQTGSGMAFENTMDGFTQGEANEMERKIKEQTLKNQGTLDVATFEDENKIVNVMRDGVPVAVRKKDMVLGDEPIRSETEVKGGIIAGLPAEDQEALAMDGVGERAKADVITVDREFAGEPREDGTIGEPTTKRMSIMAEDLNPQTDTMVAGEAAQGSIFNYVVPGAGGGQTFLTRDGVHDLQGNRLPPGGYKAGVTGSAAETGVDLTESEARNTRFLTRMTSSDRAINNLVDAAGGELPVSGTEMFFAMLLQGNMAGAMLINRFMDPQTQVLMNANFGFLSAALRSDTGAAAPITEYPMYYFMFIPMPGDSPEVIAMKRKSREVMMDSIDAGLPRDRALQDAINGAGEGALGALAETQGGRDLIKMMGGIENMIGITVGSIAADGNDSGLVPRDGADENPAGTTGTGDVDYILERDESGALVKVPR